MTTLRWCVLARASLALFAGTAAAATSARAQDSTDRPVRIFESQEIVALMLTADLRTLTRDRDSTDARYHPAVVRYSGTGEAPVTIAAEARTRGIWRRARRNCSFPPLRINFESDSVKGTAFRGQRAVKLVTHCRDDGRYEQYVLQEYLMYRIYNLLSPHGFRARLARVTYADAGDGGSDTHYGILLEDDDEMAQRYDGEILDVMGGAFADLDPDAMALTGAFLYMIGNTDWSVAGLHNMVLLGIPGRMPIAVPYDFDFAGAVDAHYATADPRVGISSVRERAYRGNCRTLAQWAPIVARFNEQRQAIHALYDSVPSLERRNAQRARSYFDEFYETINDAGSLRRAFIEPCREGA
ncbi:MAG: hypothetical protein ACRENI_09625 [Gemmatimonadaceae bacterium]